ncbi:EAL domain-containing protein [Vibrio ziniensis]|uniref:EAL domain-containing protein n=1 Tax=Vibrio ziniensis TaxID=2711221 RepID=A0A6G7CPQ6_9VIBR|nr:EAL domain-containing protein [Vibrio ziniensis]QIH44127.1 EAL domain-containing protein [Vibrio ziniensis]
MSLTQDKLSVIENVLDDTYLKRLIHIFDVFKHGVFYMDEQGLMTFYNPEFYHQFGFESKTIELTEWFDIVHPLDATLLDSRIGQHIDEGGNFVTQYRLRKANGQYIWVEGVATAKTICGQTFMIGCHRDVSDQKLMESYLHQAAFFDNATGLSNKAKLLHDIETISKTQKNQATLIYIQIDDIKTYLNQYGTDVLQQIIEHLMDALRVLPDSSCEHYRVRTDDFAVLLFGNYTTGELQHLCRKILKHYAESTLEYGKLYGDKISIGVYPYIDAQLTSNECLAIASRTCQFASENKSSRIEIYAGKTQYSVDRFFFIEKELKEAVHSRSLTVKFQPIINASNGMVASFEALVRWRSKGYGEIYPDEFIPIAEKKGLINELGYLVFSKACEFIYQYNQSNNTSIRVNVNVSVLQLLDTNFPSNLYTLAVSSGITPKSVILELTETVMLDGNKHAINQIYILSSMGFSLSLDDFGSGYSSIHSLLSLPLKQIKVDKVMTTKSMSNAAYEQYLQFITYLCRSKEIDIVFEGIEDQSMYKKYKDMGASYFQGYWFSKPLTLASASHYTLLSTNIPSKTTVTT